MCFFFCGHPQLVAYTMHIWGPLQTARGIRLSFFIVIWPSEWFGESQTSYHSISHKWKQICFVGLVFSSHRPRLSFYEPSLAFGYSGLCPVGDQSNRLSHSSGQLCFHQQKAFPSLLDCACCQWCCCVSEIFTFALALPEEEQVLLPSIFWELYTA